MAARRSGVDSLGAVAAMPPRYQCRGRLNIFPCVPLDSPQALSAAFAEAIISRNIPAALELWMDDAAIIAAGGRMVSGRAAIGQALQSLVDNGITLEISLAEVYAAGALAVGVGSLTMKGRDGEGAEFAASSRSVVIYWRSPEGWRLAIDAPWGLPQG